MEIKKNIFIFLFLLLFSGGSHDLVYKDFLVKYTIFLCGANNGERKPRKTSIAIDIMDEDDMPHIHYTKTFRQQ